MKLVFFLISLILGSYSFAQMGHQVDTFSESDRDTLNVLQAFRNGKTTGHLRYFFMATDNAKGLTDYYANAVGGGLKFETAGFHNFRMGVSGFFIYNLRSSNLSDEDPLAHQPNRYELGLFDMEDPENKNDIDRLEELYIQYRSKKSRITFGKQQLKTSFINLQDGRMRPTGVEGLYAEIYPSVKLQLQLGWLYKISPRSTVKWYSVANSIGINSQGVSQAGLRGNYRNQISSRGIGIFGLNYKPSDHVHFKFLNQLAENLFNTVLIQTELQYPLGKNKIKAAVQYIRQDAIHYGGNKDPLKTYFDPKNQVHVIGGRVGYEKNHWETTFNYTWIAKTGRFTMPREWGTEPFFTFLSRERNEGLGGVHALMANITGGLPKYNVKLELGYGHYYLPDVENPELNKYKLPSYRHIKAWADYEFTTTFPGLDLALLWIHKGSLGAKPASPEYVFNKVDMSSFNIIMNYRF